MDHNLEASTINRCKFRQDSNRDDALNIFYIFLNNLADLKLFLSINYNIVVVIHFLYLKLFLYERKS